MKPPTPTKTKPARRSPATAILVTSEGTNVYARCLRHAVANCLRDGIGTKHTGTPVRIPDDMTLDRALSSEMGDEKRVKLWLKDSQSSQLIIYGTDVAELRAYCKRIHVRPTLRIHITKEPRK